MWQVIEVRPRGPDVRETGDDRPSLSFALNQHDQPLGAHCAPLTERQSVRTALEFLGAAADRTT